MKFNCMGYGKLLLSGLCAGVLAAETAHASLARNAAGAKNIGNAGRLTVDTAGQLESDPDGVDHEKLD